jgi:hypothetical protein
MRSETGQFLERCRIKSGQLASDKSLGFNGAFFVPYGLDPSTVFKVVCSDESKSVKVIKSSESGRFVSKKAAAKSPATTFTQTVKRSAAKPRRRRGC